MKVELNYNFTWPAIITLILFFLKCLGVLKWAWIWVFSPIWVTFILFWVLFIFFKLMKWL